ncbi:MAG: 4-hydroxy-3-methylbut-2-enyl diphosphate reductase, partial [Bacteroidetes bacterium]
MSGFLPANVSASRRPQSSPKLRVAIDPGSGFCFGVVYAVEMAEEILRAEGRLYCLGDIVHNDKEVARLEAMGLRIIDRETLRHLRGVKVLIRAHGEPPETYRLAIDNELELIDASCPVVLKLQNRIRQSYERGENIYIYGKREHAEVVGLRGQTHDTATVFLEPDELDPASLPPRLTLYSQTTRHKRSFYDVIRQLRAAGTEVQAHDTICRQVAYRDEELPLFVQAHDRVVFVAGRKSSNGRMLY